MGYLLKEALKTLCGVNRWSYAIFWKIGCHNPKLLIWEECYYEPVLYSGIHGIPGSQNPELAFQNWSACNSQLLHTGERVQLLVNKMMIENQFNVVGEGLVGRAAVTGNHQWILSEGYCRETHPIEVLKELSQQFSAGMQTVAVIPVLPHGVVQLGSYKLITENVGVVNDVKTLICQLGCVPGVLLSDENAMKEPVQNTTFQSSSISQSVVEYHDNHRQGNVVVPLMKSNISPRNRLRKEEIKAEVIPSNPNMWRNQQSSTYIPWPPSNQQSSIMSAACHTKTNSLPNGYKISQPKPRTDAGLIPNCLEISGLQSVGAETHLESIPDIDSFLDANRSPRKNLSFPHSGASGLQSSEFFEASSSGNVNHLPTNYSADNMGTVENDLFQALGIVLTQNNENQSLSEHVPDFSYDAKHEYGLQSSMLDSNCEDPCVQSGDDLFDILGADFKNKLLNGSWNNFANAKDMTGHNPSTSLISQDASSTVNQGKSDSGTLAVTSFDHLLDFAASTPSAKQSVDDNVSCRTTLTNMSSSSGPNASCSYGRVGASTQMPGELFGCPKSRANTRVLTSCSFDSTKETPATYPQTSSMYGSQVSSWIEQGGHDMKKTTSVSTASSKKPDETSKPSRKRLKPGENPRPRPKDRQMIQDRVKELREIVPNGAKCSIDALLERTIKHMLFLQSVTKHADKLKQTGESKIIGKEGGLRLKDNFEGGATWAYEVGSESMVCPIIVEDLNQPRQMLVEMLCEQRGFFLEIADIIRGLGLTILKGVMETKNEKIWARFTVEANRDITRMEIFISLVHLLEQTTKNGVETTPNGTDNEAMKGHQFHQAASSLH
ncbi:PREDICTED: transcription factor LHW [Ipomoea nil]|uniref:transcription factor LHW n=1 Tax=Ipomoea nil TaxID=35883 RepID=UPI000901D84F|nr:PREDICTED: transcription factor LHW [Ipomoea nil]